MSNVARVASTAANTLTKPLNIEEVFSTYLYEGNGTSQTITNDIDLSGEGGLVWIKERTNVSNHGLFDTERGVTKYIHSDGTDAEQTGATTLTAFNSNGFSIGSGFVNDNNREICSWTFRKAPKFFDVVTYTGNGTARTISHNLGDTVGTIIIKDLVFGNWRVFHRSVGNTKYLELNTTSAEATDANIWDNTDPTNTNFTIGSDGSVNESGRDYVAYLFAHNNGDGGFGPTGDQDIIKCGSYTGNGSTTGPEIDLGFEPQWLMVKASSASGSNWVVEDNMRGIITGGNDGRIFPNTSDAENYNDPMLKVTATGFAPESTSSTVNTSGTTYIYIAIRRGPMAVPESATDVFAIDPSTRTSDGSSPRHRANFPVDMAFYKDKTGSASYVSDRLRQTFLVADSTSSEFSSVAFDFQNGWIDNSTVVSNNVSWMWKRAPNYFDVVAYTGNGTAGHTVSHNLGVAPEMMWVKGRNLATQDWAVYHSATGTSKYLKLNETNAALGLSRITATSSTTFTLDSDDIVNKSGDPYIAYLFASVDGVSKLGSYTGNGSTQNIDCGFSSGARFVLIKCSSHSLTDWHVMDSTRGIVAGNDPFLYLNNTTAEDTGEDMIDPYSSGFALAANNRVNTSGRTYIFYAIA